MQNAGSTIAVISGRGENDAINGIMHSVSDYCKSGGLEVEYFDLGSYNPQFFFDTMASGRIRFGLTYLGIGQDLEVNLKSGGTKSIWEYFNIPLLKLHGDIPAYFLQRHLDLPKNSINLYGAEEFLEFHKVAVPDSTCHAMIVDPWLIDDTKEDNIDFKSRVFKKLYFIKNGGNPSELKNIWELNLTPSIFKQLRDLSEELLNIGLRPGKLSIHEFVLQYFSAQRIDIRLDGAMLSFYVAQLDDYLRRVKSTLVGQALSRCPVVIQGSRWEHLDMTNASATIHPAQSFSDTMAHFQTQLGIIDISPNIDTICHDRLMRAAGTYTFVLTNRNSWVEKVLPELNATGFEFDSDNICTAVHEVLARPDRFVELGREYGREYRRRYTPQDFTARLTMIADMTRMRHSVQKPVLQRHMVW